MNPAATFLFLSLSLLATTAFAGSLNFKALNLRNALANPNPDPSNPSDEAPIDCAKVPPALWCAHAEITEKCGFSEPCKRYSAATANKKLQITLFFEALCPDCQEFLTGPFYREVYLKFGDFVDIELVPYGNAKTAKDGSITCQHGEKECQINKYESCVIHYMPEPLPFIVCLEARIADGGELQKAAEKCFYTFHVQAHIADQVIHCANGDIGKKLQVLAGVRTSQSWPDQHKHVPWVMFNNVSIESAQYLLNGLPTAICEFYNGDSQPGPCAGIGLNSCPKEIPPPLPEPDSQEFL